MTSSTTDRRLGLTGGTSIKAPVKAATTANITLSGLQTIDGYVTLAGDRVLVYNQTSGTDNGIYVADTGVWTRDLDFDGTNDAVQGTMVYVINGTANGNVFFQVSTADPITIGTTSLSFTKVTIAFAALTPNAVATTNIQANAVTYAKLQTETANTVLGNNTAGAVVPAEISLAQNTLLGRGSTGNIAAITLGNGLSFSAAVLSASSGVGAGTAVAAAATTNIWLANDGDYVHITGSGGPITSFGTAPSAGQTRTLIFDSTPTITYNATSLQLPGKANIVAAAGDRAIVRADTTTNMIVIAYQKAAGSGQTRQVFTSGTAQTYTTPVGCTRINVRMVGGGGGGAANATNNGSNGVDTTFSTLTAAHGVGGTAAAGSGGTGGAGTNGDINITGGQGGGGATTVANETVAGGNGGVSVFGGGGSGGQGAGNGLNAAANSGAGGGGGGGPGASTSGGGGGSGGYVEKLILAPAATYTYTVGGGGNGGGIAATAGGNGAAGIIIVDEFYN